MMADLPFSFDIGSAAFVIVDMQNDFVRSNAPLGVPAAVKTIEPINAVKDLFRCRNRPVIFTRFVAGSEASLLWTWSPQIKEPTNCCKIGQLRYYEDIKAERECIAVIDELDPQLHEATLKNLNMKFGVVLSSKEFIELAA
jgi:nicotinamidase-related amidase